MHLLVRIDGGDAQRLHIGLSVDEGRCRRGMPQYGGDDWERRLCTEQSGGKRVAQRVQALPLWRPKLDPGQFPPIGNNTMESISLADGREWRRQVGECAFRPMADTIPG